MGKQKIAKVGLLACSTLILSVLTACGGDDSKTAKTQESNTTANQAADNQASSAEKSLNEKLNTYIKCYNSTTRDLNSSFKNYTNWVKDLDAGPTGKERYVGGIGSVSLKSVVECKTDIEKAATLPPITDLDKAAVSFANDSEKLAKSIDKIYPYYNQEDYKDDDFKKGKESHAELVANAKAYYASTEVFGDQIDAKNDERQIKQLAEVEKKEGHTLPYYKLSIVIQAKKIANLLYTDDFSVEEMKGLLEDYSKLVEEAKAYSDDPANEKKIKEYGLMAKVTFRSLISKASDFTKSAKERYRSIRDKKPIRASSASIAALTTGTIPNLQRAYNDLVGAFNR